MSEKGLADVVAAETKLSDIDGKLGKLWYVGYDIHDLARYSTFDSGNVLESVNGSFEFAFRRLPAPRQ